MSHLLDTNICAAHFRRPAGLAHRFFQYGGGLYIPTVVLGELYAGAYHVSDPSPLPQKIADLLDDVRVLDLIALAPSNPAKSVAAYFNRAFLCRQRT